MVNTNSICFSHCAIFQLNRLTSIITNYRFCLFVYFTYYATAERAVKEATEDSAEETPLEEVTEAVEETYCHEVCVHV